MHTLRLVSALFIAGALALIYGCASAPSADVMRAETATFQLPKRPDADKALVYVVRPSIMGGVVRFNVFLDDQEDKSEVGYTRASQYIYFSVPPGEHKIFSKAENWADIAISVKAGDIVFLQQDPAMGLVMARNTLLRVEETQGKYYVKTLSVGTLIKPDYRGPMPATANAPAAPTAQSLALSKPGAAASASAATFKASAIAAQLGTPMPDDLALVVPSADVPAALSAFSGVWTGKWGLGEGRQHTLVVERIEGRNASLVYSLGQAGPRAAAPNPTFSRVVGAFADDGSLRATLANGATVVYRFADDRRSLVGDWTQNVQHFQGVLERPQLP